MIKGNKGEWSEFYAFLKILSDKELYSADENLALIPDSFAKVLSVMREEKADVAYEIDRENNQIIVRKNDNVLTTIPIIKITSKLSNIFEKIKEFEGTFDLPEAESLMVELDTNKIKSGQTQKADIYLKIDDQVTGFPQTKGFSVKSQVGGMSTLLNASSATNFEFKIVKTDNTREIQKRPLIGMNDILSDNETLEFVSIPNLNFRKNLMMSDSRMPELIAEIVKAYYLGFGKDISELSEHIKKLDPLKYNFQDHIYEYKIQKLLYEIALGMQPSKSWSGKEEANGGYIIVKKSGELVCYHVYNRDGFMKFLYLNTKLETPSRKRHKFGELYDANGFKCIKLNLQIRFNC